jgi:hypothetical protein
MKILANLVLLLTLVSAGCMDRNNLTPSHHSSQPPTGPNATSAVRPPPVVTADQVNEENAHAIVQALNEELDREEQNRSVTGIPQPGSGTPNR